MQLPPEDRHFRAFRRTGDPEALARVFDATAPKLLRVGVHLTRDPHAAEDLVQATFLTAIEDAAEHRDEVPVLGWLLAILANRARHLRRQSGRRPDPTRLAEQRTLDPVGGASERELTAELAAALGELPGVYSQVLELHLVHGLDAQEIARVLRRPGGTVRTQICRGLELLRRALPAGLAVGGAVTVTTGHGLAMVRDRVVRAAADQFATGAATATGLAGFGGMLMMKKTLLAVVAVSATAVTTALLWFQLTPSRPTPEVPAAAPVAERAVPHEAPSGPVPSSESPATRTDAAAEDVEARGTTGRVQLQCVWASDGAPVPEVLVRCCRALDRDVLDPLATAATDAEGMVTFAALPVGTYEFRAGTARAVRTVQPGSHDDCELRLQEVAVVHGRVVDGDGQPIADAQVYAAVHGSLPHALATTAADGAFGLRLAAIGEIWAHKATWLPGARYEIGGPKEDVVLTLLPGGHAVTGEVFDPFARPVADALVLLTAAREAGSGSRQAPVVARTGVGGRFECHEVSVGTHTAYAIAPGFAFAEADVVVAEDAAIPHVTLRLRAGATVHGVARKGRLRDQPVAGLSMLIMRDAGLPGVPESLSDHLTRRETATAADGSYRFAVVPPGRMWVIALAGTPKNTNVLLQDGQDLEWNPDLAPPGSRSIRGRLAGPDGAPLANWQLRTMYLNLATRTPETSDASTDDTGGFELTKLRDRPYDISVYAPGESREVFAVRQAQRPGEPEFVWRLASLPADNGTLLGSLVGPDGQPFDGASVTASMGGVSRHCKVAAGAAFRIEGLPPGTWTLSGYRKDYGSFALGDHAVTARAAVDIGSQRLAAPGRLVVRAHPTTVAAERLSYRLVQEEGGSNTTSRFERNGAEMRSTALPPGRYRLSVCGEDIAPIDLAVQVAPGDDTELELQTAAAATVAFEFAPEDLAGERWDDFLELEVLDAGNRPLLVRTLAVHAGRTHVVRIGLPPGAYTVGGTGNQEAYRKGRETFVVAAGAEAPLTVRVPLVVQRE